MQFSTRELSLLLSGNADHGAADGTQSLLQALSTGSKRLRGRTVQADHETDDGPQVAYSKLPSNVNGSVADSADSNLAADADGDSTDGARVAHLPQALENDESVTQSGHNGDADGLAVIAADAALTPDASDGSSNPADPSHVDASEDASSSGNLNTAHDANTTNPSSAIPSPMGDALGSLPDSQNSTTEVSADANEHLPSPELSDPPSSLPEVDQDVRMLLGSNQTAAADGIELQSPPSQSSITNIRKRTSSGDGNGLVPRKRTKRDQEPESPSDRVTPTRRMNTGGRKPFGERQSSPKPRSARARRSSHRNDTVLPPTPDSSNNAQAFLKAQGNEATTPPNASVQEEMRIEDTPASLVSPTIAYPTPAEASDEPLLDEGGDMEVDMADQRPDGEVDDAELLAIAARFRSISQLPANDKKKPRGRPPLWAQGRQALCETLPSNHALEGSYYVSDSRVWGAMFDAGGFERDYTGSAVVITNVGGGKEKDAEGNMVRKSNQFENIQSKALRAIQLDQNPIIISVGKNNPTIQFGFQYLPKSAMYAVLCWFVVTDVWHERDLGGNIIVRCRFERLIPEMYCWFDTIEGLEPKKIGDLPDPYKRPCKSCGETWDQIACEGWMCLNGNCSAFWKLTTGRSPDGNQILYDPRFLQKRSNIANRTPPYPLRHTLYDFRDLDLVRDGFSLDAKRGRYCQKCGCCGALIEWSRWKCPNEECEFVEQITRPIIPARMIENSTSGINDKGVPTSLTRPTGYGPSSSRDVIEPLARNVLESKTVVEAGYRVVVTRFPAPGKAVYKVHWIANKHVNSEDKYGADYLWLKAQEDWGQQRQKQTNNKVKGKSYTGQFSRNFGEKYHYVVAQETIPFEQAPEFITRSRTKLDWAAEMSHKIIKKLWGNDAVGECKRSNEALGLAYLQKMKLEFHDDGEDGLDGTIGSLSLGADATMEMRMHPTPYHGVSVGGLYVDMAPVEGCVAFAVRSRRLQEFHQRLTQTRGKRKTNPPDATNYREWATKDPSTANERRKIAGELSLSTWQDSKAVYKTDGYNDHGIKRETPVICRDIISHGDLLIMIGRNLQEYYLHRVTHNGSWLPRFCVTTRRIDPLNRVSTVAPDPNRYYGPPEFNMTPEDLFGANYVPE